MLRLRPRSHLGLAARLTAACGLAVVLGGTLVTTASAGLLPGLNLPLTINIPGVPSPGSTPAAAPTTTPSSGSVLGLNLGGLNPHLLPPPPLPTINCVTSPCPSGVLPTPKPTAPIVPTPAPTPASSPPPAPAPPAGTAATSGSGTTAVSLVTTTATSPGGGRVIGVEAFPVAPRASSVSPSTAPIPGLNDTPPLPVETLGAVPGISFGRAPYLWPLFLLLDLLAAVAVVVVVRKGRSGSAAS